MLEDSKLRMEMEGAINWISSFAKKSGANGVVIGNSGGKDSAVVIAMATKALGKENVVTAIMPCKSINDDIKHAYEVAEKFGARVFEIDLERVDATIEDEINIKMDKAIGFRLSEEAKVNIKPRLRMLTLYSIAQSLGYLVIGTGNLSERMVGYTTKWGDNAADFNPIANFTVQEVLKIGEYLGVPKDILQKAPSDGISGLTDEQKLGVTYKQIDEYIETGITEKEAMEKIEQKYKASSHKRAMVPIYEFERENYLEKI